MMRGFQLDLNLPRVFAFSSLTVAALHEKPNQLRKLEEHGHGHVMDTKWNEEAVTRQRATLGQITFPNVFCIKFVILKILILDHFLSINIIS